MTQEEYDIQMQVDHLMQKVLDAWKSEGKWDGNNPNSPFYGFEKDPLLRILLTAFVYQTNGLKHDMQDLEKETVSDFQSAILPYQLTKAVPAFTFVKTAKNAGDNSEVFCDESTTFLIRKESLRQKETFPFQPLFRTKIVGMQVSGITKIAADKWNVNINVSDQDADLSYFGFLVSGLKYADLNVYWNNEKLPLIKPWEFDRFPINSWFCESNEVYNKSLLYKGENQWQDLWAMLNVNYYMVAPTFRRPLDSDVINLVFEFSGMSKPFNFEEQNLSFNCVPVLNVFKKDFMLSSTEPIVRLAFESGCEEDDDTTQARGNMADNAHPDFFMNLVMSPESEISDLNQVTVRRFGTERFNLNELVKLANDLRCRYESDFYAFQKIHKLQNTEKIRRLDIVLKDIIEVITSNSEPKTGVYAVLKHGAIGTNITMKITGMFTDGSYSNDIDVFCTVTPPKCFDGKETRLVMKTFGGRDEVIDKDEKNMLAKYYIRTADRIVTRADLKAYCQRYFIQNGMSDALVDVVSVVDRKDGGATQHVTIQLKNDFVKNREDVPMLIDRLKKLIEARSVNILPLMVDYLAVVS